MRMLIAFVFGFFATAAWAADFPAPREASWTVRDFRFHSGEVLPELRLNYTTVGSPGGEAVVLLHGTTQSGTALLNPAFGGELCAAGQPLDASRYYVILPDSIGHGKSSKPSDGLRQKFPRYSYEDMVDAHQRLVSEHLGLKRMRLVLGNSMGGMQTWIWAQKYPRMMDIAVPMASQPVEMSSRNWIMRRLIIDSIRRDPKNAQFASVFYAFGTSGGNQALYKAAPTREKADELLDARLKAPFPADPDDVLYQWDSSRDYNPSAGLERCKELGAGAAVVLGHTQFYPRFGFLPAAHFGLGCEYDVPRDAFMAMELRPGALRGASGTVRYHREFGL